MDTTNSLAHTKWECKYHIVFAPKYRRQVIYKDIKADVGQSRLPAKPVVLTVENSLLFCRLV